MFSFRNLLAAAGLAALATSAQAKIYGITAEPGSVSVDDSIQVTVSAASYIQNWEDSVIQFGLSPSGQDLGPSSLGRYYLGSYPLSEEEKKTLGNFTVTVPKTAAEAYAPAGSYTLKAAVPYVVGASQVIGTNVFNTTLEITE